MPDTPAFEKADDKNVNSPNASDLEKTYDAATVEAKWSTDYWAKFHLYEANADGVLQAGKKPFTVLMPPPNITGSLTMGHVLNHTLQDIFIRYRRMTGYEALWLPGTDHAGIATQTAVEKSLRKEKLTRYDLGREKFLERVREWREDYGGLIVRQLRKLGVSCDWRRNLFTMDDRASQAVTAVFVRLYNDGLIYRGKRIINWCPVSQTALSDEEVIMKPQTDKLYFVKYFFADNENREPDEPKPFITVATVRPETILGDVAIAVNPNDERYKESVGKVVLEPLTGRKIPVIADDYVEIEFGTGALKITPAHDANDYQVGQRHNLPIIVAIDQWAKVAEGFAPYSGLDRFDARKKIAIDLEASGNLEKVEDYAHSVGYSERADVVVEPFLSEQWFVDMKALAAPALDAALRGDVKFHPERWLNTYRNWLENIHDWCISRQLWWGHRIPAWYDDAGKIFVAKNFDDAAKLAGTTALRQDDDVFDTWFSSWLWPMTTLGWNGEDYHSMNSEGNLTVSENDIKAFYPTSTLVTGPDIIFFWVARMIMAGLHFNGDVPFRDVYFTSIIRDSQGRKMSKSLGNSPDPLEVMATYGTDALRFTVIYLAPLGQDVLFATEKCEQGRNFATKIWNAARFLLMNRNEIFPELTDFATAYTATDTNRFLEPADRWMLSRLNRTLKLYHAAHEQFRANDLAKILYEFIWGDFCDWYVEIIKTKIQSATPPGEKQITIIRALKVFEASLQMLHPIMPFITEELWQSIVPRKEGESISVSRMPQADETYINDAAEKEFDFVREVITKVRSTRNELGVPPAPIATVVINAASDVVVKQVEASKILMGKISRATFDVKTGAVKPKLAASSVVEGSEIFILLEGLIDLEKEKIRLAKEQQKAENYVKQVEQKLSNEGFALRAPKDVLDGERMKLETAKLNLQKISASLEALA
ncbi:MAG: valine--tRNA ligase [Rhizobacter sp.]|nr:valine--tRNA ligase [Chlorobiales bacterium]